MEVIPAIDLRGGRCVRLVQGDYQRETVFSEDPIGIARLWVGQGAPRLHVVDLDGAREGEPRNLSVVAAICKAVDVPVQLGGGIRSTAIAKRALKAGVSRVILGTSALDPAVAEEMAKALGESLIAGIDARGGKVAVRGWLDTTELEAVDLARRLAALGLRWIVFTDIGADGMLAGPNLGALKEMVEGVDVSIIASGGISSVDDVRAVREAGAAAAIIGKALYAGRLTVKDALEAACSQSG